MAVDHALTISPLFVPANRPERIDKAIASAADLVIVDLEDAVSPAARAEARATLADYLAARADVRLALRINAVDSVQHAGDAALCRDSDQIAVVMLPKTESAIQIAALDIGQAALWPLVETPAGVLAANTIAAESSVDRLAFGALDLAAATGIDAEHEAGRILLDQARARLVLASAAADIAPPLDSPHPAVHAPAAAGAAAARAVAMGFGGMLAVHPAQLGPIRSAFQPSEEARVRAERVVAAAGDAAGAIQLDGRMIDAPVVAGARRLLARAERLADERSADQAS